MNSASTIPPPLPAKRRRNLDAKSKILIACSVPVIVMVAAVFVIRFAGLARPFSVPTGAMSPAIRPGDLIVAERFSLLKRKPARGDIVVFKTDGIRRIGQHTIYVKRIAGEPGDQLRLAEGNLIVNGCPVSLSNAAGRIRYQHAAPHTQDAFLLSSNDIVRVPPDSYFMLGDNSAHSFDSRYYGFVPATSIIGRVAFCYWPPDRAGAVK